MVERKVIYSIIPARRGSKGISNKNVHLIAGKPLIAWSIEQSINTKQIQKTFVSTNDKKIAEISQKCGAEIIWRPDELCTDKAPSESALIHAINTIKEKKEIVPDIVVFLQATSPLRKKNDLKNAISLFINKDADSLISGAYIEDFLIWEQVDGSWNSVNFDYKNRGRRQDRKPQFVENGSIYIFKPDVIKREGNRIGGKITLYEMEFWQTWELDKPEDISLIEFYLNTKIKKEEFEKLRTSKIELIAIDFDGVLTDNTVITLQDGTEGIVANRSDGLAIRFFKKLDIPMIIISTEKNPVVKSRADKIGLPVIHGVENKKNILVNYCTENSISLENVIFIGNDLNDMEVMEVVGWPVCPVDAEESIKNISRIILDKKGGKGVIRDLYGKILN